MALSNTSSWLRGPSEAGASASAAARWGCWPADTRSGDQGDAGESTRMPDTGSSNPFAAVARKRGAYTSEDMTDDAIAVLDALGWERAHLFGASLGGTIADEVRHNADRAVTR